MDDSSDNGFSSSASTAQKEFSIPGAFWNSQSLEPSGDEYLNEYEARSQHTETITNGSHNNSDLRTKSCQPPNIPTTPTRKSMKPSRAPASDPGPRSRARETLLHDRSPITRAKHQALCGKLYTRVTWYNKHQTGCRKCHAKRHTSPEISTERNCSTPEIANLFGQKSSNTVESNTEITENENTGRVEREVQQSPKETGPRPEKSDYAISYDLHVKLKSVLKERTSPREDTGVIYFLQVPEEPGLVKLGLTKDEFKRGKQHQQKCKLDTTYANISIQFAKMKMAEKFLKIELDHLKEPWYCDQCHQEHEEWFKVDVKQADQLARRWRRWINDESPYSESGFLKESWEWFIEHEMPKENFEQFTHEVRWAHWSRILEHTSKAVDEQWQHSKKKHRSGELNDTCKVPCFDAKPTARLRYNEPATVEIIVVLLLIWACLKISDIF